MKASKKGSKEQVKNPDFEAIKKQVSLGSVAKSYGIELKRQGKDLVGLCPFHSDTKPSLRITEDKGLYRCPACGATGNVIQFVANKEGITDKEAAFKLLENLPGVQLASALSAPAPTKNKAPVVEPVRAAMLLKRVAAFYHKALFKNRAGLDYLKSRNLDDPAMLETFNVGYCDGTLKSTLPESGKIVDELKALGVLYELDANEVFYKRVVIPIYNEQGEVVGLYGRHIDPDCSSDKRHRYLSGDHLGVFNYQAFKSDKTLFLTECIVDAMSLWQGGYRNVVAAYGVDGWTTHHERLLRKNQTETLITCFDNDKAGREGIQRLTKKYFDRYETLKAVHSIEWPEGIKDANDFFLSNGPQRFKTLFSSFPSCSEKTDTARKEEGGDNATASGEASKQITLTADGFNVSFGERRYELFALEKPSPSKLRATLKVLSPARLQDDRFYIDTIDFLSGPHRKRFSQEASRLLREAPEKVEDDLNAILIEAENFLAKKLADMVETTPLMTSDDEKLGRQLGKHPDLFGEISRDLDKLGIIGEHTNRSLGYLVMTSRKMSDPLALQILSSSGAGKSHLQDAILDCCPEEDLIKVTSLSDQALFYKGEDSLKHKVLAIEEEAGASGAAYAIRNLISAKKLTVESTIKNSITGKLQTQLNIVYGPTAVFQTTTNPHTDAETKSRFMVISVDESGEQTKSILVAQRSSHTLDGLKKKHHRERALSRQHAFQRLLKPITVVNPYEPLLTFPDERLTMRRDQPKFLNIIVAITFMYQMQRPVKVDPEIGEYIETTLGDIAIANELAHVLFGQQIDELSQPAQNLLRLIVGYVEGTARKENKKVEDVTFTRRQLREAIHWGDTRLRTHLNELVSLEYVSSLGGSKGQTFTYTCLVQRADIAHGGKFLAGLKSLEQLEKEAKLLGIDSEPRGFSSNLVGENGNLAPTSQVRSARLESESNSQVTMSYETEQSNLAGFSGKHVPEKIDGEIFNKPNKPNQLNQPVNGKEHVV